MTKSPCLCGSFPVISAWEPCDDYPGNAIANWDAVCACETCGARIKGIGPRRKTKADAEQAAAEAWEQKMAKLRPAGYEAWRISFQSSEQAARYAYEAMERFRRSIPPAFIAAMAERARQVSVEGYTPEGDKRWIEGELAAAASEYATAAYDVINGWTPEEAPIGWPDNFDPQMWKPSEDPTRNVVKAMALLAAQYEVLEND